MLIFRHLQRGDGRESFESGEAVLDEYLRKYAHQGTSKQTGATYVLVEEAGVTPMAGCTGILVDAKTATRPPATEFYARFGWVRLAEAAPDQAALTTPTSARMFVTLKSLRAHFPRS